MNIAIGERVRHFSIFLRFSSYEPAQDRRTDRRTGKTRNAADRTAA